MKRNEFFATIGLGMFGAAGSFTKGKAVPEPKPEPAPKTNAPTGDTPYFPSIYDEVGEYRHKGIRFVVFRRINQASNMLEVRVETDFHGRHGAVACESLPYPLDRKVLDSLFLDCRDHACELVRRSIMKGFHDIYPVTEFGRRDYGMGFPNE